MRLKQSLLYNVIENSQHPNRYSRAFSSLKNVFEIEKKESESSLGPDIKKRFKEVEKRYDSFISDIPLIVIERYYFEHRSNMNKFVYLEYDSKELADIKISELFMQLEMFYEDMLSIACYIANLYNLEIKLNNRATDGDDFL